MPGNVPGDGPGGQPLLRPAPLVPGGRPGPGGQIRAIFLLKAGAERRPAQQLAGGVRRELLGASARIGPLLLPHLRQGAAGPELGKPGGPAGDLRYGKLVAGQGGFRLPAGRHHQSEKGPALSGRPRRQPRRHLRRVQNAAPDGGDRRVFEPAETGVLPAPRCLYRGRGIQHYPGAGGGVRRAGGLFLHPLRLWALSRQPPGALLVSVQAL